MLFLQSSSRAKRLRRPSFFQRPLRQTHTLADSRGKSSSSTSGPPGASHARRNAHALQTRSQYKDKDVSFSPPRSMTPNRNPKSALPGEKENHASHLHRSHARNASRFPTRRNRSRHHHPRSRRLSHLSHHGEASKKTSPPASIGYSPLAPPSLPAAPQKFLDRALELPSNQSSFRTLLPRARRGGQTGGARL